jgi:hypothetical protein
MNIPDVEGNAKAKACGHREFGASEELSEVSVHINVASSVGQLSFRLPMVALIFHHS